ncbi:MAG: HAMP domain-containing sensor histidine kinase [Actinomycetaceae bacterium]|nr:HAMP domain-containing sensor histidine kinase [Actinomycetaceae bacterium]
MPPPAPDPHPSSLQSLWSRATLRFRLVSLFTLILTVGFLVSGAAMLGILQAHLVNQVDRELHSSATSMAVESVRAMMSNKSVDFPSNYYLRLTLTDGSSSVSITDETRQRFGLPLPGELLRPDTPLPTTTTLPVSVRSTINGSYWRAVAVPIAVDDRIHSIVTIALPLRSVSETVANTSRYFTLLGLIVISVGALTSHYLVRRALVPLARIETVAGKIAAGDITQRIEPEAPTTEVGSLAVSLNRMLSQIERSFAERDASQERMKHFISDASHELRTPLAAIRGYGELYRIGAVSQENIADVMGRIESESTRMGALVEDLLTLARLDEKRTINPEAVDLVEQATNAAFDCTALDPTRVVQLISLDEEDAPHSLMVEADRDQITQVFTNLIGNVVRYTPQGSPVEIALGQVDDSAVVEIRDHGPGISAQDSTKVFTRFYRTDVSRSRASGGSGLGLAIVASIVALHGGQVEIDRTAGGGLTVRIALPLQQSRKSWLSENSGLRSCPPGTTQPPSPQ